MCATLANLLPFFRSFSFSFLIYSCHGRRFFFILSNYKSLELNSKKIRRENVRESTTALRLSLVITEFSWHILIGACGSVKKIYSKKHEPMTSTEYQTNLTQNGYHLLPSVMVSYKQVSNIWTYFSLTHILLRSPEDISCSCQFSPLFQVVFLFIFDIFMPQKALICAQKS